MLADLAAEPVGESQQCQDSGNDDAEGDVLDAEVLQVSIGRPFQDRKVREGEGGVGSLREEAIRGVSVLESTLQAASQRPTLPLDELLASFRADAGARDRIVGGDACHQLALDQREDPRLEPVARVFVDWWANSPLNTEVPGAEHVRAPGQD